MIGFCTAALLPSKPSSDDDSWPRHSFGVESSLPSPRVIQQLLTKPPDFWDCHSIEFPYPR